MPPKKRAPKKTYEPRPSKRRAGGGDRDQDVLDDAGDSSGEPLGNSQLANEMGDLIAAAVAQAVPAALAKMFPPVQDSPPTSRRQPDRVGLPNSSPNEVSLQVDDDDLVSESVQQHIGRFAGKDVDDDYEEESSFLYNLTDKELRCVARGDYVDFLAIYRRVKGELEQPQSAAKKNLTTQLSKDTWVRIFIAFQAEHTRVCPKDAPAMAAYQELILSMESLGMDWQRYDENFRIARARRLQRGDQRPKPWNRMDVPLYVACSIGSGRYAPVPPKQKSVQQRPPSATVSKAPSAPDVFDKKMNTCWKFQDSTCDGSCLWPFTHSCYYCGGEHPTRLCPALRPDVPKPALRAPAKDSFREGQDAERTQRQGDYDRDHHAARNGDKHRDGDRHHEGDRHRGSSDSRRRH